MLRFSDLCDDDTVRDGDSFNDCYADPLDHTVVDIDTFSDVHVKSVAEFNEQSKREPKSDRITDYEWLWYSYTDHNLESDTIAERHPDSVQHWDTVFHGYELANADDHDEWLGNAVHVGH